MHSLKGDPIHGLRSLTRSDIDSILNAAACNVLSVISNEHVDAYLLSESSLFVSDMHLMIKTCGATRLLHALPVILKLVHEKLPLQVTLVQFSRVSYFFPNEQTPPHNSFRSEVAFLDDHLLTTGKVYETPCANGSSWYLYFADMSDRYSELQQSTQAISCSTMNIQALWKSHSSQALEIYMFDLDPCVMRLFMYHERTHFVGIDKEIDGTTARASIKTLLPDEAIVDAFNFDPCGYSMNAVMGDAYYSIHVSPEPEASYVSFETTKTELLPQLIASVVKLFQPGRFKVAVIESGEAHERKESSQCDISWPLIRKLLRLQCFRQEQLMRFAETTGSKATVASFYDWGRPHLGSMTSSPRLLYRPEDIDFHLNKIADSYNATWISDGKFPVSLCAEQVLRINGENPCFLIDLGSIVTNLRKLSAILCGKSMYPRYAVRCNSDKAILTLLSYVNIDVEVVNGLELDLVQSIGVPRDRIVLATPVVTKCLLSAFEAVGTVAIFGQPSNDLLSALKEADVCLEIRVSMTDLNKLGTILSGVLNVTDKIKSIGVELNDVRGVNGGSEEIQKRIAVIQSYIREAPSHIQRGVTIHIGEVLDLEELDDKCDPVGGLRGGLSEPELGNISIGIDISRVVVSKSVSLLLSVIGKRDRTTASGECEHHNYYLNDGVYGALNSVIMDTSDRGRLVWPRALLRLRVKDVEHGRKFRAAGGDQNEMVQCTLFGPTCDAIDRIWDGQLSTLEVGDAVLFEDVGAYSFASVSEFNGFARRFDAGYLVRGAGNGKGLGSIVGGLC